MLPLRAFHSVQGPFPSSQAKKKILKGGGPAAAAVEAAAAVNFTAHTVHVCVCF